MKHVTTSFTDWKKNESTPLPSHLQIGDLADLSFGDAGTLKDCIVAEVHFTKGTVSYDFSVPVDNENSTKIKGVDATMVQYKSK